MEANKAKAGEEDLSMEEILQSIRKIIAEDGEETPAATNGAAASASDVLELTEMVEEAPVAPVAVAAPAPSASASQDEINDILNKIDQVVVPAAPVVVAPAPQQAAPAVVSNGQAYIDSLLSNESASAASAAFKKAQPVDMPIRTTPSMPLRDGNTVENLVMEALKPMLKAWLDANLPTIVERLVEREVRKIAH